MEDFRAPFARYFIGQSPMRDRVNTRGRIPFLIVHNEVPMDKKPLWNDDKTNGAMWGAGLVAAALIIGGSFWPGWQLDSTAEKMAVERAQVATVAALAPVCADK